MSTPWQEDLDTAIASHQEGRLDHAAAGYRRVLAQDPDNADALHLLGVVALQRGQPKEAVERISRAIGLSPSVAAFHANLAEAYRALGEHDRAIGCCRTALRLQPNYPEAANSLGLALVEQGELEAAAVQFRAALGMQPEFAAAHTNLANALRKLGQSAEAVEHLRAAVRHGPHSAEAHTNLGHMLLEAGDLEGALHHCREAVRLRPNFPEAHNNLGNVLREQGRFAEARSCYAEALRLNPDLALTHANMGRALQREGLLDDAVTWYHQAALLDPNSAQIHFLLAGALEEQENYEEAVSRYEVALRLDPEHAAARNGLGWVRHQQGHFGEALEHYRAALRIQPDFLGARCNLGGVLQELGDLRGAEQAFRAVLGARPRHTGALGQLATLLRDKLPPADAADLEDLLAAPDLSEGTRMGLLFARAHVRDARRDYAGAASDLEQANALALADRRRRGQEYDAAKHAWFIEQMIATCSAAFFDRVRDFGVENDRPVFIVGLPRSGTTLTEQILAAHPQVAGAGELDLARQTFLAAAGPEATEARAFEALQRLGRPEARRLAGLHLNRLGRINATALRIVDKMPDNYMYLGLLAALFPRARFIHCRRDLRDIAVSCWLTNFRHIRWANDPADIGSRFAEYLRLMDHWRRVLPIQVLEVNYEDTVADLEGVARRLVAWCGLEWDPACLAFHETKGAVRTASLTQVRQPIYRKSVARWKHYEEPLARLFAALPQAGAS
jgi:tetratricopeptide (TPR) repeat protein